MSGHFDEVTGLEEENGANGAKKGGCIRMI
jgi:hypothetical protein